MRVLWVSDFPPGLNSMGGFEANMDLLGAYGTTRGHESTYIGPYGVEQGTFKDIVKAFDTVIFGNTFFFQEKHLEDMLGHKPHFNMERDFGFCISRHPECHPWQIGSEAPCGRCPLAEGMYKDPNAHLNIHIKIMNTSEGNFFCSPLQYNIFKKCLEEIYEPNYILPPMIQVDQFYPIGTERHGYLYVGKFSVRKGVMNALKFAVTNPGDRVILAGFDKETFTFPQNCIAVGRVPNKSMNNLYNAVDAIIIQPEIVESGPRTLIEACLAGCDYIANEKVGILSLDWPFHDQMQLRKKCREVPIQFWETIEKVI